MSFLTQTTHHVLDSLIQRQAAPEQKRIEEKCCALTGCNIPSLLIESHIKPRELCESNDPVDPYNKIILEARFERLFSQGFISFADDGSILLAQSLTSTQCCTLGLSHGLHLRSALEPRSLPYLRYHREHVFQGSAEAMPITPLPNYHYITPPHCETLTLFKYLTPAALDGLICHGDFRITFREDANDPTEMLPIDTPGYIEPDHFGAISFTTRHNNHPMWGNYAACYTGACVKLEIPYFKINEQYPLTKLEQIYAEDEQLSSVQGEHFIYRWREPDGLNNIGDIIVKCQYSDKPCNYSLSSKLVIGRTIEEAQRLSKPHEVEFARHKRLEVSTKHTDWAYEDEYRLPLRKEECTRATPPPMEMCFSNALTRFVTEIILAPKSTLSQTELERQIARKRAEIKADAEATEYYLPPNVSLKKARFETDSYAIIVE